MTEERTGEMTMDGCCWLCGKNGRGDPLDTHHIFGGAYRNKSEKYGLTVQLCHENCHIFGKYAAHANAETMRRLREYGQREAMRRFGWTVEQFRREFGKNYLDECGVWSVECGVEVSASRQTENTSPARGLATSPQGEDRAGRRSFRPQGESSENGFGVEESGQMFITMLAPAGFCVTAEELPF